MASYAIYLTIVLSACTATGFKLNLSNDRLSDYQNSNFEIQPFVRRVQNVNEGPIAGYPKHPPPNAHESGGQASDLLPPHGDGHLGNRKSAMFRRSVDNGNVDPKTGYPLLADPSWKSAGGNEEILELPLENSPHSVSNEAVDPKTGYPLNAQPSWAGAGGDETILQLPLEDFSGPSQPVDSKTEFPFTAQNGAAGGTVPVPLDDLNVNKKVDPKTGYPLVAEEGWNYAGGTGDILDVPLEEPALVSVPKVDPKTGYPLVAEKGWKDAGGNGDILQVPIEDTTLNVPRVDPKTGYPLVAEAAWKDAGGTGDILELPIETSNGNGQVDPKTGYPLVADLSWKNAGGNGGILQLPKEDSTTNAAVDPKTGYPLVAQPEWKDAGGNGDILDLPVEDSGDSTQRNDGMQSKGEEKEEVDPKTGYPLKAQPAWEEAGGNGDILQLPIDDTDQKVDPKTGYPLEADPKWELAGGDETILEAPFETPNQKLVLNKDKVLDAEELSLTELLPPAEKAPYSTGFGDPIASTIPPLQDTTVFNEFQSDLVNAKVPTNTFIGSTLTPTLSKNDFIDNTFHTTSSTAEVIGSSFNPGVQQHQQIISAQPDVSFTSFFNPNDRSGKVHHSSHILNAKIQAKPDNLINLISKSSLQHGGFIQSTYHGTNPNHLVASSPIPIIVHPKVISGFPGETVGLDNLPAPTSYQVTNIYRTK